MPDASVEHEGDADRGIMRDRRDWPRPWLLPALGTLALVMAIASQTDMYDAHFYSAAFAGGIPGWTTSWPYPPLAALPASAALASGTHPNLALVLLVSLPCTLLTLFLLETAKGRFRVQSLVFASCAFILLAWSYANRLEPVTVTLAVAGLLASRASRPRLAGVLLGLGGLVKAWPLVFVAAAATWRRWSTVAAALVTWALMAVVALVVPGRAAWGWIDFASGRGVEAEAFAALPALWAQVAGVDGYSTRLDGATAAVVAEGPGVGAASALVLLAVATVVGIVTFRCRSVLAVPSWTSAHASHALLLVVGALIALPVLSPQFIAWPIPVLAVALIDGWLRRMALIWLGVCALTTVVFPLTFVPLMYQGAIAPLVILTVRDALILAVFAATARRLWVHSHALAAQRSHANTAR